MMDEKPPHEELTILVQELEQAKAERKRMERILRESDERFSKIFYSSPVPMSISSFPDGRYTEVNDAWCIVTGFSREEAIGHTPVELNIVDHEIRRRLTEEFLDKGFLRFVDTQIVTKSGEKRDILASVESVAINGDQFSINIMMDVTERKRAEKALRESEKKHRDLFENSHDLIYSHAMSGRILSVNPYPEKILGYAPNELLDKNVRDIIISEKRHQFDEYLEEIKKNGFARGVMVVQTIKGDRLIWEYNNVLCTEDLREPVVIGMGRDVTKQVRAEKALRESERHLSESNQVMEAILKHTHMMTALLDPQFNFLRVNRAYADTCGHEPSFFPGRNHFELYPHEENQAIFQRAVDTGEPFFVAAKPFEFRDQPERGVTYWDWSLIPVKSGTGKVSGLVLTLAEVTQRICAEKGLRESEAKYRSMMESMIDPVYICSPEFTIEYMNPAMIRRTGRNAVGEKCYSAVHGLDSKCEWCIFDKIASGKSIEVNIVSPEDNRSYRVTNMPVKNHDESLSKMTILRDITDYLVALEEREKAKVQLQQSQKMESIGNLAGGIAHDFNNILSSIIGFTELSLDYIEKGTLLEDNLQEVYSAGKRAKDLVKQILAFARQTDEELKPIQVDTIVKEVLKFIRSSIPTTIEIKQNVESGSFIMGDPTQIHQILMNLCTNAAHAMEDKGGILELSLKDVVIGRSVDMQDIGLRPGDYIEIKVSDTGVGIASEIIGSIFEPYFTTKGPGEGTGMGLAMVHGIVESYGGKITVDSMLGSGAVFSIYLPITKKRKAYRPYESTELASGTERILFVDDEASIAKMGSQALESLGYSVTMRTSSIEALELFRAKSDDFDLVITDTTMPNMTGDMLAVELMNIRPDIPVILCTGYSKRISDETASEIGVRAFVYKPVIKADLAKTVRKVLDEKQKAARILFIDDDPQIRKLFMKKMAESGYETIAACDGNEGIRLYRENKPDLVITDLVMPKKEGIETIFQLKKEYPDVKIIALSGGGNNGPDDYLSIAKSFGAMRTFSKPIDWAELIKAIKDLLN